MLLAFDIGNTNIVLGCIDGDEILFSERISTDHSKTSLEYALTFRSILSLHKIPLEEIGAAIIASVVPPITSCIENAVKKLSDKLTTPGKEG